MSFLCRLQGISERAGTMVDVETVLSLSQAIIENKGIILKKSYSSDLYTHCANVAELSVRLGIYYNLNLQELTDLGVGGYLHDYGKISITDSILNKPTGLSDMEFYLMQAHPSRGYRDLKKYNFNTNIMDIVLKHHEKLDGSGYPSALSDLSILVQITTVSDMFDAIHSKRSYHDPVTIENTIEVLKGSPGLNQVIVKVLADLLSADSRAEQECKEEPPEEAAVEIVKPVDFWKRKNA